MASSAKLDIIVSLINEAKGELDELKQDIGDVGESTKKADRGLVGMSKALIAAGAAAAAFKVGKMAYELGTLGAQAERTEQGFETISGGASSAAVNLDAMMAATDGAIDRTTAMQMANQMMMMGIADTSEGLARNAEMATRLGRAMGVDAIPAMENWNAMIANQSLPRLDTYGISSGKVRERINELMAATEGLTREQAFNIAVMAEGQIALDRLGDSVDDNALSMEQAAASAKDLRVELGMRLSNAVGGANTAVGKFTRQWGDNLRIMREAGGQISLLELNVGTFRDVLGATTTVFDQYQQAQEHAAHATEFGALMAEGYAARLDLVTAHSAPAATAVSDTALAVDQYNAALSATGTDAQAALVAHMREVEDAAGDAAIAMMDVAASFSEVSQAQFAQMAIDDLTTAMEAAGATAPEITAATRDLMIEFGFLTAAEESAQGTLGELTRAFTSGEISAGQFKTAVLLLKDSVDSLESKDITVTANIRYNDPGWGGPGLTTPDEGDDNIAFAAGGFIPMGGSGIVGDAGVERIQVTPAGVRVVPTTTQTYNINNTFQSGTNPNQVIGMQMALYGGG